MDLFDIHSHILPELDDGFVRWDGLRQYFRLYRECGISGVAFTPHLYDPYVRTDVPSIRPAWEKARAMAEEEGLYAALGSEIYLSDQEKIKGIPIIGEYYLVEFPVDYAPPCFMEKLEAMSPIKPVIAHIERYKWLTPESPIVGEMKERGYLLQVNAKALKREGKAKEYAERGIVDILASDSHGRMDDIIDLAEMISSHQDIMSKMSRMARHLKEVVGCC